ncbi:MAG: hypothetical protein P8Z75_08510 [Gammaproteobacteria bacterium]|jgi:hypothetical protein
MLSYLVKLASEFERKHGQRPNLLYINQAHFQRLRQDLAGIPGLGELVKFLGMEVVIAPESNHPHLSYSHVEWQTAIAV